MGNDESARTVLRFTVRRRLAALFLFVLALVSALALHHTFRMVGQKKADLSAANRKVARDVAARLDALLEKSFAGLKVLSSHPAVTALASGECDALFARLLPAFPETVNIVLADLEGDNRGSALATPGIRALSHRDMEWFQRAAAGETVVNDLHVSKIMQAPTVMIAAPVQGEGGRRIGVLGMPLDLTAVARALQAQHDLPPASVIRVTDAAGTILIDTLLPGRVGTRLGTTAGGDPLGHERRDRDGTTRLYSSARPAGAPWEVRVGVPTAVAYRAAEREGVQRFLSALLLCALALVPALFFTTRNVRRLERIREGLRQVEHGDLRARIDLGGSDEFTDLGHSFNRMVRERREGEESLRASQALLASTLDGIGEGVLVIDRDYRIIAANRSMGKQAGRFAKELLGRHCFTVTHHADRPCWEKGEDCPARFTFQTGEPWSAQHTHLDREEKPVHVELRSYPLRDASGALVSVIEVCHDATERFRLEQELRHAQKLEAVGQLASGVAHDFNNILTAVSGFASLVTQTLPRDDPHYPHLQQILAAVKRASALTRSLLAFSRKQVINPKPVDIAALLRDLEKLLARIIGEDIELRLRLPDEKLVVLADPGQIEQVLMNLAANARDAMPDGGVLAIEAEGLSVDQEYARAHGFGTPGNQVRISVTDTGVGMDEKTQESIFEPFFTTKEPGKGTGLGLSIAFGIISQHAGHIHVASEPGTGTTMSVWLPRLGAATAADMADIVDSALARGSATVLVADDDESVRAFLSAALETCGYRVLTARDGDEALARFAEQRDRIDLLLLDLVMPKKGGLAVYEEIRDSCPRIKVIFTSGYPRPWGQTPGGIAADLDFLPKPLSTQVLLETVRDVLSRVDAGVAGPDGQEAASAGPSAAATSS